MPAYLVYTKILGRMIHSTMLPAAMFLLVSLAIFDGFLKTSYTNVVEWKSLFAFKRFEVSKALQW